MQALIDILHTQCCSLVLLDKQRQVRTFNQKGVRDLNHLLTHEPDALRGAMAADKVIGKAAAGMIVVGGVQQLYAEVLSRQALPLLDAAAISYSYGTLVDRIVMAEGEQRCPLEQIVEPANTAKEVVRLLQDHFREMAARRNAT